MSEIHCDICKKTSISYAIKLEKDLYAVCDWGGYEDCAFDTHFLEEEKIDRFCEKCIDDLLENKKIRDRSFPFYGSLEIYFAENPTHKQIYDNFVIKYWPITSYGDSELISLIFKNKDKEEELTDDYILNTIGIDNFFLQKKTH